MTRPFAHAAVLAALILSAPACGATESALDRLSWLAGCWRSDGAEHGSGEQWLAPAGGTMLGISRTVRRGATVAFEFMQLREAPDGRLLFIAQPGGEAPTAFTLVPGAPAEAVFENPEHDFPQRVIYRLEEGGRLRARIEGSKAGVSKAVDFPMTRAACDAQPALPEAFQGLPWGAGEAQMLARFGPLLKKAECREPARKPTPGQEACDHPLVASYPVAGIPFRLNLHVDSAARQLVRVSLSWAGETSRASADNGWGDKHRQLRQLLSQRYGGPESTHVDSDPSLSQATARWRRGDTLIELTSMFLPRSAAGPARDQVEIVYRPVTSGEAGKL
jgi:hypothetical protein